MFDRIASFFIEKAYAIDPIGPNNTGVTPRAGSADITTGVQSVGGSIVNILTIVAGAVAVLYLIWYGIQYIMSGGSPDKAKTARAGIINAVIGIVIITAAYAIIRFAIAIATSINTAVPHAA